MSDVTRPFTQQELVGYAIPRSPKFAPGASYDYSNTNTVLLGMIVEQLTGLHARAGAGAAHPRPARPRAHELSRTPCRCRTRIPSPYEVDYVTHAIDDQPFISPTSLAGSGAMVSTLDDMQVWAQALGDGRLIGAQLQQQRIDRSRPATNGPHYDRYGLGIGILDGWLGHTGNGIGFQAAAFYDPRTKATIAVLVNATASAGAPANLNFAEEIFLALGGRRRDPLTTTCARCISRPRKRRT